MAVCKTVAAVLLAAVAFNPVLVLGRLSADVTPSSVTGSGQDWCQDLKPCNETKTTSAEIESVFGFGLTAKSSSGAAKYQYENVTPAAAIDWRTVLTNWTVRDQGTCGTKLALHCTHKG